MAEKDLCLLLDPKRYFVKGRKLEYILDCLLEPEKYEAFTQNSEFYPEDLQEFHLNFAGVVFDFKADNNGKLSREFVIDNLPILLFGLQKMIHHRINRDIRPLLSILSEFANIHNWFTDFPNVKKLVTLFREYTDYKEFFFDGVKQRIQEVLLPIYQQIETYEVQGGHMIAQYRQDYNRLKLQIIEQDQRLVQFKARPIAKKPTQENTHINELNQKIEQKELEIAKMNKEAKYNEEFKQRCQQQIDQLTDENQNLQVEYNKIFAELRKSKQRIEELSGQVQQLSQQIPMIPEPQQLFIRTIGYNNNGLFEYDGQQFRRVHAIEFNQDGFSECVTLSDGRLFVCGGYTNENTCIITPDNRVKQIAKMNQLRNDSAIIKVDERIYVFGGEATNIVKAYQQEVVDSAEYYDINENTWTNIQPLPDARKWCGAAYYNESIYVGGGYLQNESKRQQILRYDINRDTYTPTNMRTPPIQIDGSILFIVGNTLYTVSGREITSYNVDTQQHLATISTKNYFWWSCMPPVVQGDEVILALTRVTVKLVRLNYKNGNVTSLGNLHE